MASMRQQPSGSWRVTWRDPAGRQRARHFAPSARLASSRRRSSWTSPAAVTSTATRRIGCCSATTRPDGSLAGRWNGRRAARDESLLRVHLLPRWGRWALPKIDHLGIQQWVAELGRRLAPATVRECYRVLSLILRSAVHARLLASQPV